MTRKKTCKAKKIKSFRKEMKRHTHWGKEPFFVHKFNFRNKNLKAFQFHIWRENSKIFRILGQKMSN